MSSLSFRGLATGLNNSYWFENANITIDAGKGDTTQVKVSNGTMLKEIHVWKDDSGKKHKSIFMPGQGYKEWCNRKLVTVEKYSPGTIRSRAGVSRYTKEVFGKTVTHLQKKSSKGGFTWEEVYWQNGKLMYKYSRGQKKGKFFNEQGQLWGIFDGELEWRYLYNRCILNQRWSRNNFEDFLREGPSLKIIQDHSPGTTIRASFNGRAHTKVVKRRVFGLITISNRSLSEVYLFLNLLLMLNPKKSMYTGSSLRKMHN